MPAVGSRPLLSYSRHRTDFIKRPMPNADPFGDVINLAGDDEIIGGVFPVNIGLCFSLSKPTVYCKLV